MKKRKMILTAGLMVTLFVLSGPAAAEVLFYEDFTTTDGWKTRPEYTETYDINYGAELVQQDVSSISFYTSVNSVRMGAEYHYSLIAPPGYTFENVVMTQTCFANTSIGGVKYGRALMALTGDGWVSNVNTEVSSEQSGMDPVVLTLDCSVFDGSSELDFYIAGQSYYATDWCNSRIYDVTITGDLVIGNILLGDANGDGVVSAGDYACVQSNLGNTGVPGILGDANYDGVVSEDDYDCVEINFGNVAESTATPEPATMGLIGLGALGLIRRKK